MMVNMFINDRLETQYNTLKYVKKTVLQMWYKYKHNIQCVFNYI